MSSLQCQHSGVAICLSISFRAIVGMEYTRIQSQSDLSSCAPVLLYERQNNNNHYWLSLLSTVLPQSSSITDSVEAMVDICTVAFMNLPLSLSLLKQSLLTIDSM